MRTLTLILLLLALSSTSVGGTASLLDFKLRNLIVPETHSLMKYRGKPILVTFFQPDCNWCAKQIRAINELIGRCDISAVAVGVGGNRADLRKEARRIKPKFPAYQASPEMLESLGGMPATPMTMVADASGELQTWSRGFLPEDALSNLLFNAGISRCESN